MKFSQTRFYLSTVAAIVLCAALNLSAATKPEVKSFTYTTKSKDAKEFLDQATRAIESYQFGDPVNALAKKAIEADPDFAFAQYIAGVTSASPQNAKPYLEKAFELVKTASEGERRFLEAVSLLQTQKPNEALAILTDLSKQYPNERRIQMVFGQVSLNQGKVDDAQAAFEKAMKLDNSTARVYGFLGNVFLLKGDYKKAGQLFKESMSKKGPGTAPFVPYYGLVYTHLYEGKPDQALKELYAYRDEYIKTGGFPGLPVVFIWNSIARINLENGHYKEALEAYQKGYESVPGSTLSEEDKKIWYGRLHHGTGRTLARMGKFDEAWKEADMIKKMIEEGGERGKEFWPSYHYIAGYIKLESGDFAAAIEHLKQAHDTDPFHLLLLARAYEKSGDQANAQKTYKQIVDSKQINLERALAYPEARKKLKTT